MSFSDVLCEYDFDYFQDIARAGFGDMLHDDERNKKYYEALKIGIQKKHELGEEARVLDIGTGTGLLSMMAVASGADSVYACEAFSPMSDCAEKIIEKNGMKNKIKVIHKRSTDLTVGSIDSDMPVKANILVAEVFDTDLIGEYAIQTFCHAHEHLLEKNCIVIPNRAIMYAQIVESPLISKWKSPKSLPNLDGEILIHIPDAISNGCSEISHDLQMSQLSIDSFKILVNKVPVFEFDWSGSTELLKTRNNEQKVNVIHSGLANAIFVWWELEMDQKGEIILSCAPYWEHPDNSKEIPWRDHWMQAIYYIPKEIISIKNEELILSSFHNEFLLKFKLFKSIEEQSDYNDLMNFYSMISQTRIGQLNDTKRNKKFLSHLEDVIDKNSIILGVGDLSLILLAIAKLEPKQIYLLQENTNKINILNLFIDFNKLINIKIIKSTGEIENIPSITHIIAEPYFDFSILPWNNFYFGQIIEEIKSELNENVQIIPKQGIVYCSAVQFKDLQKILLPVKNCEGFDLSIFDDLMESASSFTDTVIEAQPLWEYPCKFLSTSIEILNVEFNNYNGIKSKTGRFNITFPGKCNGIVFWVDWSLDGSKKGRKIISSGPVEEIIDGEYVKWDMYTRQGVHLLHKEIDVDLSSSIEYELSYDCADSNILWTMKVKKN